MKVTAIACLLVVLCTAVASADTFVGNPEPDLPIGPDPASPHAIHTIQASPSCVITDVDICVDIRHTWVGDLTITVTHAPDPTVVLMDRPGVPASTFGCSNDLVCANRICFDDAAGTGVETYCPGVAWPAGSYNPDPGTLAGYNGDDQAGAWTIDVGDGAAGDTGALCEWRVVTTCAVTAVEPATWGQIKNQYSN